MYHHAVLPTYECSLHVKPVVYVTLFACVHGLLHVPERFTSSHRSYTSLHVLLLFLSKKKKGGGEGGCCHWSSKHPLNIFHFIHFWRGFMFYSKKESHDFILSQQCVFTAAGSHCSVSDRYTCCDVAAVVCGQPLIYCEADISIYGGENSFCVL